MWNSSGLLVVMICRNSQSTSQHGEWAGEDDRVALPSAELFEDQHLSAAMSSRAKQEARKPRLLRSRRIA